MAPPPAQQQEQQPLPQQLPTVWTWGRAKNYRLGREVLGHDSRVPEPVRGFEGVPVDAAACGGGHTAVALRDGRLLAFGYSQYGQLGLGDRSDTHHPTPVFLPPSPLVTPADAAAAAAAAAATAPETAPGTGPRRTTSPWSAAATAISGDTPSRSTAPVTNSNVEPRSAAGHGSGSQGSTAAEIQTKLNPATSSGIPAIPDVSRRALRNAAAAAVLPSSDLPVLVPYNDEGRLTARVAEVCCGRYHTIARSADGAVYTWGGGKNGRLGHGDEKIRLHPGCVEALLPRKAVAVTAGYHNNLVLTEQGDVWSWGWGAHGQLGLGDTHDRDRPTIIEDLSGHGVTSLSCGDRHSFAVTSAGTVFGWGSNEFGQLGTARRGDTLLSPAPIPALDGLFIVALACGDRHSAAVTNVGAVYTWGCGTDGQCGHGDLRDVPRPRLVEALAHIYIVSIHCGHNFTIAMSDKGHVYAWGNNAYGQLGNNGIGKSPFPVRVSRPSGTVVSHVACAHFHCVLITKSDAELAAEQPLTSHRAMQDTIAVDENAIKASQQQDDVTVASSRLTAILEEYSERTANCNATAEKQSRELVIADILRLSSAHS